MSRTDSLPDVQDLKEYFRGRVRGDAERWNVVWAATTEDAVERREACEVDPREWPYEVETITRRLRSGMAAGRAPRESGRRREQAAEVGSAELGAHQGARAHALAELAEMEPTVLKFRATWLPGGAVRVSDDEVREWVADNSGETVVPWVTVDGATEQAALAAGPGQALRSAADRLARVYGWDRGLAAAFVVAGGVVSAPMLTVRTQRRPGGHGGTAADSITVKLHPDVPVGEVVAAVVTAQAEWGRRPHLISSRVAEAVALSVSMPGGPTVQNKALGERCYTDAGNFRRTVERAKTRLTGGASPEEPLSVAGMRAMFRQAGMIAE